MSSPILSQRVVRLATPALAAFLIVSCSGGGGGGGSSGSGGTSGQGFVLSDVQYGRLVTGDGKPEVVSPLSTIESDPITGNPIPGTLQPLTGSVDLDQRSSLGLAADYLPRVVPRNGVFVVRFTEAVDPSSVRADVLDSAGNVVKAGTVRMRFQDGRGVPLALSVRSGEVWINPVTKDTIGLPPSPVDFGSSGEPRADATGFLRLSFGNLSSAGGAVLGDRADGLGTTTPIGLNPGNEVLDFVTQNQLIPTSDTFNGFLPDLSSPRIVREYRVDATLDFGAGDSATATSVTVASATHNQTANGGLGEWAGGLLVARPGKKNEETHQILQNSNVRITLVDSFDVIPGDGDVISLRRAEFFEPDRTNPIDPDLFDPNNPQNFANEQLVNFVQAHEIDANGKPFGPAISLRQGIPAFSELRVRFNEPMDLRSFGQWESFQVALSPDPGPGFELLTRIRSGSDQREVSIQPARMDPTTGAVQTVGWGPGQQFLSFTVVSVPTVSFLQDRMPSSTEVKKFLAKGIRGVRDLGGLPLAFPEATFDVNQPESRYTLFFQTDEALSSQNPPPVVDDWGVIVHRFQGTPTTGTDVPTGNPGVRFPDQTDLYWPIAEVNLQVNGFLAGQPVTFIRKVHDDFNPPPDGQFSALSSGTGSPLASFFTSTDTPPWEHNGARFQQVWRDVDCSPGAALQGTILDLYQVSWAPIGGNVTGDVYEDISIHAAHSPFRPITVQSGGGAVEPYFALSEPFDFDTFFQMEALGNFGLCVRTIPPQGPNYYDGDFLTVVPPGTRWVISQAKLFSVPGDANSYHPYPEFQKIFQYNNGGVIPKEHRDQRDAFNNIAEANTGRRPWLEKRRLTGNYDNTGGDSLFLEIRIRPQMTPISRRNGYTAALGILSTADPFFRVYSLGIRGNMLNPDDLNDTRARCATDAQNPTKVTYGDNTRYFTVFDYVKTTSTIHSPYTRVTPGSTTLVEFYPALVEPALSQIPSSTQAILEFQGANSNTGNGGSGFDASAGIASGFTHVGFRVTFIGNTTSFLSPNFDTIAIPYLRMN